MDKKERKKDDPTFKGLLEAREFFIKNFKNEEELFAEKLDKPTEDPEEAKRISLIMMCRDLYKEGILVFKKDGLDEVITNYYDKSELADKILNIQPLFYDKSKIWWLWNKEKFKWEIIDDVDVMNFVKKLSMANTIQSKERMEILEALKQEARKRKPKEMKKTWVQFHNLIVDVVSGEEFEANANFFITNPIPWKLHKLKYKETPIIDRIFEEWVGEDHVKTLKQIIAYCLIPDYPIHRIFCFIGGGLNGKSKFLELLIRFLGEENTTSTELDSLINLRFERTKLHRKLACIMGETNFNEISRTSMLKKLTGQDTIGFEYKNKDPFDDYNYAKILISTNNLPTTTDKTVGFYRRWSIIDFPNEFSEEKEILDEIPDEEYESLATNSVFILKELLEERKFHKEGTIEERTKRYEEKSDFMQKFLLDFVREETNGYITKTDFKNKFNEWCDENRHRKLSDKSISQKMREKGYEDTKKHFDWLFDGKGGQIRIWTGISWDN